MGEGLITTRTVRWLGIITLLFFGVTGLVLIVFVQHRDALSLVLAPKRWWLHALVGIGAGGAIAAVASWVIDRPFMDAIRSRYVELIGGIIHSPFDIVFVSVCAGVGEELFFRGALQHWLGIAITAVLFVAIHGYLDPRSWRMSIYGGVMTFGMMALGWMTVELGLLSAMVAHATIDVVLLAKLAHAHRRSVQS